MPDKKEVRQMAKTIVKAMTLEEKVQLCTGGSYWETHPVERFQIGPCVMSDGPHGVRKVKEKDHLGQSVNERATGFPTSVAMGATWNQELLYETGQVLGRECQAVGVDILLGPAVNMKRSVLGGRNFEYLSEDPVLAGKLGAQIVKGVQSTGTGACVKHFACNNSESKRMTVDVVVDGRTLHELYLKVFEIIVREAAPMAVMSSYNKINGCYACEHRELLTDILRNQWGFDGIVLSDWLAVDECVKAVDAGMNLEMPGNPAVYDKLSQAVNSGELEEETLNQRVEELLTVILTLIKQRNPAPIPWDAHRETAREVAAQSMVLLKNEGNLLPIDWEKTKSLAVIGDFAVHPRTQGGGSSKVETDREDNILTELTTRLKGKTTVRYAQGYDASGKTNETLLARARETAAACDRVVIFAGLPESYESEGYDRSHMKMPDGHLALIREVAGVRRDVLVVLSNGSAIELPFLNEVDAVLEAWLLGQETAGAIAGILLNEEQPSGRMPETFPRCLEEEAAGFCFEVDEGKLYYGERMMTGYRYFDKKKLTPAVPFGFGLSYTEFEYSNSAVSKTNLTGSPEAEVAIQVKNIGPRPGYEVVQLYLSNLQTNMLHPEKELKDFAKIYLEPGEETTVTFHLNRDSFQCYSEISKGWIVQDGNYRLYVGASSRDIRWSTELHIAGAENTARELTMKSTLEEWIAHPRGKALAEEMLKKYRGFGMSSTRGFEDLSHFVQRIMLEMPMPRLATASNQSFTQEDLRAMLDRLEKGETEIE